MPSVLTLDLGNTSLKGVLWEGGRVLQRFRWMRKGRALVGGGELALERGVRVLGLASRGLSLEHGISGCPPGEWVGREIPPPLRVEYEDPGEMGWDRRVAAYALHRLEGEGLVLDAGTCLTLTHVDREGNCRGFGIAPGLGALAGGLRGAAPDLARDLPPNWDGYPSRTGCTRENLQAGLWAAFVGAARELLAMGRERLERAGLSPGALFLTGSDGELLAPPLGEGRVEPLLIHRGLLLLGGEL
ncbi:MAG TPA: type III pantothenate kinase [Planctomycetes bacterium]|nr:type III pantothenate kinase [Planctomycetota bacterium]